MTGPEGNIEFCFPGNIETLGKQVHCSPRDQSLSDLLYSKIKKKTNFEKRAEISAATAVNISRVIVNYFAFDVIHVVFPMLPAHGIWRETVSLLQM